MVPKKKIGPKCKNTCKGGIDGRIFAARKRETSRTNGTLNGVSVPKVSFKGQDEKKVENTF